MHTPNTNIVITSSQVLPFDVRTLLAGQITESSIAMYRRDIAAYNTYTQEHGLDALKCLYMNYLLYSLVIVLGCSGILWALVALLES